LAALYGAANGIVKKEKEKPPARNRNDSAQGYKNPVEKVLWHLEERKQKL
jgi:hypothetical protein